MEFAPETSAQAARSAGMLVVDDHELVRLGLRTLVHSYALSSGRTLPVFEACTLQQALGVSPVPVGHQPGVAGPAPA